MGKKRWKLNETFDKTDAEAYSKPSQKSKMERFAKKANG